MKNVEGTPFVDVVELVAGERSVVVHEFVDFIFNHVDVNAEIVITETELDEFLLFHEHLVRAIVDDILSKAGGCKMLLRGEMRQDHTQRRMKSHGIRVFCGQKGMFPAHDEVVSIRTKSDCYTASKEDEGENISVLPFYSVLELGRRDDGNYLLPAVKEKLDWVLSVSCSRSKNGNPVEDHGWPCLVLRELQMDCK